MRINANVCFQLEFQLRFCTIQELHWRLVIHRFTWPHLSTTMGVCCKLIATFALFRHVALRSEESRVAEIWRYRDVQCAMCVVRCSTESTVDHTDPVRSNPIVALSFWAGMQLCSNCNQRCIRQRTDRLLLGAVAADRRSEQRGTGSARRLGEQVTSARLSRSSIGRCSCTLSSLSSAALLWLFLLFYFGWGVYPAWSFEASIGDPEPLQKLPMHFPWLCGLRKACRQAANQVVVSGLILIKFSLAITIFGKSRTTAFRGFYWGDPIGCNPKPFER